MKRIRFIFYYIGKVILVKAGLHRTENPLGFKWRWNYWSKKDERRRERKALYELSKPSGLKRRFQ